ncbi:hypothetical protein BH20ACT15_BH20ACT15_14550 [soil metagenome]
MTDVDTLLRSYIERFQAGESVDPSDLLNQLDGRDRARLSALIDGYLEHGAPPQAWDAEAFEGSVAEEATELVRERWEAEAAALPAMLVERRKQAKLHRSDLVTRLADALGFPQAEPKVARYYNAMEHGWLEPRGVSDKVFDALASLLDTSADALRKAGEAVTPSAGGEPEGVWARTAPSARAELRLESGAPDEIDEASEAFEEDIDDWDEVDRLFRAR